MLKPFDLQVLGFDGRIHRLQFGPLQFHDLGHLAQNFLQENRVCGKAIKVEPHARNYSRGGLTSLYKTAVSRHFSLMRGSA